jgi:hypothetical protein
MGVRVLRGAAVMIMATAFGLALAPLHASGPFVIAQSDAPKLLPAEPSHACHVAVIDAWHARPDSGWFGYAPLTSTPLGSPLAGCRAAAQHRLRTAAIVFLVGVFVALLAYGSAPLRHEPAI